MNRKNKFYLVFIIILIIGIGAYSSITHTQKKLSMEEGVIDTSEIVTAPEERTWKDIKMTEYRLNSDISDSLFRAMILKEIDNQLYVSDFGDMKIKRFDLKGVFLDSFGEGRGRGPGEFELILGFTSLNNSLYVQDPQQFTLHVFDKEKTAYQQSVKTEYRPHRLITVGENLVAESLSEEKMFKIHNEKGDQTSEFGHIVENQIKNALSVAGEILSLPDSQTFIYAPAKTSYLMYYNLEGENYRTVIGPDRIDFAESIVSSTGEVKTVRAPESDIKVEDIIVNKDKLYVLLNNTEEKNSTVDVYKWNTGKYLYSFKLLIRGRQLLLTKEKLYAIDKTTEQILAYTYE